MRKELSSKYILLIFLISAGTSACTQQMKFDLGQSDAPKKELQGGGGIDGKIYVSRGSCDGKSGLISSISFPSAGSASQKVLLNRDNCLDLPTAQVLADSDLQFADASKTLLTYKNRLFDLKSRDQRVTGKICSTEGSTSPSARAEIWGTPDSSADLFGKLHISGVSGETVKVNSLANEKYETSAGQTSQFTLTMTGLNVGYLSYINGGTTRRVDVNCAEPQVLAAMDIYLDGSVAPGNAQYPNLLNAYAARPSWKSPGIDYAVGVPVGTVLKNPLTAAMTGVTVNGATRLVTVSGDDITLDGYDFSLNGGWTVQISGAKNTRIINSSFAATASQGDSPILIDATSSNVYVGNSTIDGGGAASSFFHRGLIVMLGQGLVVEHSWLKNAPQGMVDSEWGGAPSSGGAITLRYNLLEGAGKATAAAAFYLTLGTANYSDVKVIYNTTLETTAGSAQGLSFYNNGPVQNAEVGNNVMLAKGTSSMAYFIHMDQSVLKSQTHNNYFDLTGALAMAYAGSSGTNSIFSQNLNLVNGVALPTNP